LGQCGAGQQEIRIVRQLALALVFTAGIGSFYLTATPQTPEAVRAYLASNGYMQVQVKAPAGGCGKAVSKFEFTARDQQNRPFKGEVCAGAYQTFYTVRAIK
jgi:hypothetical protein